MSTAATIPSPITNGEDCLDSRDIQKRIEWLESAEAMTTYEQELQDELKTLKNLKEQYVNDFGEKSWESGAQFIRDSYFEEYAQDFASDCGFLDDDVGWPANHIDWTAAADELKMDYTEIEFGGVSYQTREA